MSKGGLEPGELMKSLSIVVGRSPNGQRNAQRTNGSQRRNLPPVERVLQALGEVDLPRTTLVNLVRQELANLRRGERIPEFPEILVQVQSACEQAKRLRLQPVINGTGVLLHTNLGRAPLGSEVLQHVLNTAARYNNLEYDLEAGTRGHRATYLESNLALLCGAPAATVVNNCAAALVLVLRHLTAKKPEVIISRGELIQIGGGFRIPEILAASQARLREIGTTNKTSLEDYAQAIGPQTGLLLKVHRSNFFMDGFVESPATQALAALARTWRVPLVEDLGSGAMFRAEKIPGLEHEPTPAEVLKQGVSLVTFSGDKLLGGPQAGIIAGASNLVTALKREPFFRALRCDKLVLAALEKTAELYLEGDPGSSVPLLRMLRITEAELVSRGEKLIGQLNHVPATLRLGCTKSQVGGGSLPRSFVPSVTLDVVPNSCSPAAFAERMRRGQPPVLGQVSSGLYRLHLRTVFPDQDEALAAAIKAAAQFRNGVPQ